MRNGEIAYQGIASGAVKYFSSLGHPLPYRTNPAEHILDILFAGSHDELAKHKTAHVIPYLAVTVDEKYGLEKPELPPRIETNWLIQFSVIFIRACHRHWRQRIVFWTNILSVIIVSIFVGYGSWHNLGNSTLNLGKRPAVIFYCVIHQGLVYSYQGTHAFPLERAVMLRERQAGSYRVSAYFLGKCFADLITQIPGPIIFSLIVYPLVGLNNSSPQKFRNFILLMVLSCNAATSMVNMISCIFVSIPVTMVVIGIAFEITRLFGGWYVPPVLLVKLNTWKFADAISYMKYGFIGASLNEYLDLTLCTPAGKCSLASANAQILKYGYQQYTVSECAWYLFVLILGFRFISYLGLRFIKI